VTAVAGLAPLDVDDGGVLLTLARSAVMARLAGRPAPEPGAVAAWLREPRGAFVTVLLEERLRGCIGVIRPREPLWRVVLHCAVAAGFEDPRFAPLQSSEEPGLAFEVSVLSLPRVVSDPSEIRIGRDGLIVTLGRRQGLLLPQVAIEHGWDASGFLNQTSRKAGLGDDAWRQGARIEAFEAQVFSERPRSAAPGANA
jgi:AmmeMemoRadiSam system protein A